MNKVQKAIAALEREGFDLSGISIVPAGTELAEGFYNTYSIEIQRADGTIETDVVQVVL